MSIHAAIRNGWRKRLNRLIDEGYDVDTRDENYQTPLELAIEMGDFISAKVLVEAGCEINYQGALCSQTPLEQAIENEQLEITLLLVAAECDITDAAVSAAVNHDYKAAILLLAKSCEDNLIVQRVVDQIDIDIQRPFHPVLHELFNAAARLDKLPSFDPICSSFRSFLKTTLGVVVHRKHRTQVYLLEEYVRYALFECSRPLTEQSLNGYLAGIRYAIMVYGFNCDSLRNLKEVQICELIRMARMRLNANNATHWRHYLRFLITRL